MALQTKTITANGSKGHHKFTLTVNEDSTNAANNTSTVSWSFVLSPITKGYNWEYSATKPVEYTVTINGVSTTGVIYTYDGSSTVTVKTGSSTISHNADGTKSISVSFNVTSLNVSYLTGSANASSTMSLTSIPRGVVLTSAPDFTDVDNPTITYTIPSGSTASSIQACISLTGEVDNVPYRAITTSGTYTFALTDEERAALNAGITSGSSVSVRFYIKSVINGQTYWHYLIKTYSITGSSMIKLSPTLRDTNSVTASLTGNSSNIFVRYASVVSYTTGATASSGGTITKHFAKNGSELLTTASGTFKEITSDTFTFTAMDNRGNSATKNIQVTLIPYVNLTCSVKATSGVSTDGTAEVTVSGKYYNGSFGGTRRNSLSISARAISTNETTTTYNINEINYSEDNYTAKLTFYGLDYQKSYTFEATAQDAVKAVDSQESGAVTGVTIFDWGKDDFAFHVPVTIEGNSVPTIVEEGTSGIWRYRKWSSGVSECWGTVTLTTSFSTTWGSLYASGAIEDSNVSFPSGLFIEVPNIQASLVSQGVGGILMVPGGASDRAASKTQTGVVEICRGTSTGSSTYKLCYNAKGRWK